MNGSSDIRKEAKFESTANRESTPLWSERRVRDFLSTRTPERWLMGLLAFTFSLLVLIRLKPVLLSAIFG